MNYSSKVKSMGINNFNYRRYSFDYFLDSVKRLGLDTIELCGCHPHFTVYEYEEFPVGELAQKIKDHGIKVSAIIPEQNFLPINIAAVNEYLRQQSVEQIKFYVKNAKAFDCDKVIVYPGKAFMNYPQSEAWMRARKSLKEICETAKECDVTILLEGVSNFISSLMMDSATVKQMLDEIEMDNLKVCVNSCAAYYAGETLADYFELFGDKIEMVQLADCVPDNDHLIWGDGEEDFKLHLDTLEKYGYTGAVTMELNMEEYADDPETYYGQSLEYFKNL